MIVSDGNWARSLSAGWRWVENCSEDQEHSRLTLAQYIGQYGYEYVTLGVAFDLDEMKPCGSVLDGLAIYVADVSDILEEMREDLLNYECGHPLRVVDDVV